MLENLRKEGTMKRVKYDPNLPTLENDGTRMVALDFRLSAGEAEIIHRYHQRLGKLGGVKTSPRKTAACRRNGKKGGRPKKS